MKEKDGTKRNWMANLSIRTNFSKSIVEYFQIRIFSKFVSINFRWRGDRKKVERPFHRFGNGVCVQSLSYLAEPPSIRDCHPGYEQL